MATKDVVKDAEKKQQHVEKPFGQTVKEESKDGKQQPKGENVKFVGHEKADEKEYVKRAEQEKEVGKAGSQVEVEKAKARKRESWPEMPVVSKSKEVKRLSRLVCKKKRLLFRGRFGNRAVRNVADKKWQKWRKPRGADIYFKAEDGLVVDHGYGTPLEIRGVHPSGFRECLVRNANELEAIVPLKAKVAARIAATVGAKKKRAILRKAAELGVVVLNA